jgi:hypothetical protein
MHPAFGDGGRDRSVVASSEEWSPRDHIWLMRLRLGPPRLVAGFVDDVAVGEARVAGLGGLVRWSVPDPASGISDPDLRPPGPHRTPGWLPHPAAALRRRGHVNVYFRHPRVKSSQSGLRSRPPCHDRASKNLGGGAVDRDGTLAGFPNDIAAAERMKPVLVPPDWVATHRNSVATDRSERCDGVHSRTRAETGSIDGRL